MLHLSETRRALGVVADQIGGPTPARAIAEACLSIADQLTKDADKSGTYHFSGAPDASWHDFAQEIFLLQVVTSLCLSYRPARIRHLPRAPPLNSRMDLLKHQRNLWVKAPSLA